MNHIEVFHVKESTMIEEIVNSHCYINKLNPISVSVTHIPGKDCKYDIEYIVTVVVEPMKQENER